MGNLATVYRRRGWYSQCDAVLPLYKEMLDRHKEIIRLRTKARVADDDEVFNQRDMEQKYYRIALNLAMNLKRPAGVEHHLRYLMQFEIDTNLTRDDKDEFVWMINSFCNKPLTSVGLRATTDAELVMCFHMVLKNAPPDTPENYLSKAEHLQLFPGELWGGSVQRAVCAGYQATEPCLNMYKKCSRCNSVKYCSKVS